MPELPVTDDQLRRLESVCDDLEAAYVGPYGTVRPEDALEYLLDTYEPPAEDGSATDAAAVERADDEGEEADAASTPDAEPASGADADGTELTAIDGVGEVTAAALSAAGFDSVAAVEAADPAALTEADGVGEKQAVDIVAAATAMDVSEAADDEEAETDDGAQGTDAPGSGDPDAASPSDTLQQAMSLLEAHDGRWRESSGDEPYEVDLPDGSTEGVRTKDDVKRLLFKHWK